MHVSTFFKSAKMLAMTGMVAAAFVLSSCGGGDDEVSFNTTPAAGKIGGADWSFVEGSGDVSDDELRIDLYNTTIEEGSICGFFFPEDAGYVFFSVPNEVGTYDLELKLTNLENARTVTFFTSDGVNVIVSQGAVEITAIDTETGVVSGRLDARTDDDNDINGTFEVSLCDN